VSHCLTRLGNGTPERALFAIPNGTGHAEAYRAFSRLFPHPIYGALHPHLSTGASLEASTLGEVAYMWAINIWTECEKSALATFELIGASLGGLMAHLVALSCEDCDLSPSQLVLIDPIPPVRLPNVPSYGVRDAAYYLALHSLGIDFHLTADLNEAEICGLLEARRAESKRAPVTARTMFERHLELRAATHLLSLTAHYQRAQLRKSSSSPVCLVLASERSEFLLPMGYTPEDTQQATARQYGVVVQELALIGGHLEVCMRCICAAEPAFNATLLHAPKSMQMPISVEDPAAVIFWHDRPTFATHKF